MTPRPLTLTLTALLLALAPPAQAQTPLEPRDRTPGDGAAELGRLFYTPERRAALERQRQYNIMEARALEGATLRLDGVVSRSSGKSTVWVNGRPNTERDAARSGIRTEIRHRDPGRAVLTPGDDNPTALKVGEVVNRGTGDHDDRLGGGTVVATPRK